MPTAVVKHAKATKILKKVVPKPPKVCELKPDKIAVLEAPSANVDENKDPLKIKPP